MSSSVERMIRLFFILFVLINISNGSLESDLASIPIFPYIENEWDCSEMSFYLQHKLEELGYNAQVAQTIGDPGHSWVMVITDTEVITVEATLMKIMPFRSDWDKLFRNATDAMNHCVPESEVDWWNYHAIK
jgi:hypothetical protein